MARVQLSASAVISDCLNKHSLRMNIVAQMGARNTLELTVLAPCGNKANQPFVGRPC